MYISYNVMLDFVVKEVLIVCDHSFEEMDVPVISRYMLFENKLFLQPNPNILAVGIVRTSVIVTGVQVCSRIFMVWFIASSIRQVRKNYIYCLHGFIL